MVCRQDLIRIDPYPRKLCTEILDKIPAPVQKRQRQSDSAAAKTLVRAVAGLTLRTRPATFP